MRLYYWAGRNDWWLSPVILLLGIVVILFVCLPAAVDAAVPVKDRCGDPDVLKSLAQVLDRKFPTRAVAIGEDKSAFVIDTGTALTEKYDENLDKVSCRINVKFNFKYVDPVNQALAAAVMVGLKYKYSNFYVYYTQQYVSGSDDLFNTRYVDLKVIP